MRRFPKPYSGITDVGTLHLFERDPHGRQRTTAATMAKLRYLTVPITFTVVGALES